MKSTLLVKPLFIGLTSLLAIGSHAEPPELQTPSPVIYLAENLNEPDMLGWCIDTLGRGFSEQLQTHSCKPQGGDVQFSYSEETKQIMSVEFPGKCADLNRPAAVGVTLDLLDCDNSEEQQFVYNQDNMEFMPLADQSLCLAAGAASRSAGPFVSRTLNLAPCNSTEPSLKQWVIKAN